ncbi:MAG: porin family protein [Urechidicola sp.]|nr:porin family protein [Urechidicola sp.]
MKKALLVVVLTISFILNVNAQRGRESSVPVDVLSSEEIAKQEPIDVSDLIPTCGPATGNGKIVIRGYVAGGVSGLTKSGFGFSDMNNGYDSSPIFSWNVGADVKLPLFDCDKFGFRTGLSLQTNGAEFSMGDFNDYNYKIKLIYVKAPAVVEYDFTEKFNLYSGLKFGYLLSAKQDYDGGSDDIKDQIKSIDFGGVLGAEYKLFCNDKISLGAGLNYDFGLSDINDYDGADKNKNSGITAFFSADF